MFSWRIIILALSVSIIVLFWSVFISTDGIYYTPKLLASCSLDECSVDSCSPTGDICSTWVSCAVQGCNLSTCTGCTGQTWYERESEYNACYGSCPNDGSSCRGYGTCGSWVLTAIGTCDCTGGEGGAICGNGVKEGTEQCDDGNITPGDGCSPTCTFESGGGGGAGSATCTLQQNPVDAGQTYTYVAAPATCPSGSPCNYRFYHVGGGSHCAPAGQAEGTVQTSPYCYGARNGGVYTDQRLEVIDSFNSSIYSDVACPDLTVIAKATIFLQPTFLQFSGISGQPAPSGQTFRIANTGDATLNWTGQSNQAWCYANGVNNTGSITGSLAPNASSAVTVTVSAPASVGLGNHNCTITVSDPNARNTPQTESVTYNVVAGDPSGVSATTPTCGQINLSWTAGSGAISYDIYRDTFNSAPVTSYRSGVPDTNWTDTAVIPGVSYYYWISTQGGTGNKIPANTNGSGGIGATTCAVCDWQIRQVPGSGATPSQPVGIFIPSSNISQFRNSIGVVVRGMDSQMYYQNCLMSGSDCAWTNVWSQLTAAVTFDQPPYSLVSGSGWEIYAHKPPSTPRTYRNINGSSGWSGWVDIGNVSEPWGTPNTTLDGAGRTWLFSRGGSNEILYQCALLQPPAVAIDTPANGATVFGPNVNIRGWAIDNAIQSETAVSQIRIYIDGSLVWSGSANDIRSDVCAAYPGRPGCPNVGYTFNWNSTTVANGSHTIRVEATDTDPLSPKTGVAVYTVNVNNLAPSVIIDAPVSGATVNGSNVLVQGWALDNQTQIETAISSVRLYVDGILNPASWNIQTRNDVCAAYPGRAGCPNVGYYFWWNSTVVANGPHTIRVDATDSDALSPRTGSATVNVTTDNPTFTVSLEDCLRSNLNFPMNPPCRAVAVRTAAGAGRSVTRWDWTFQDGSPSAASVITASLTDTQTTTFVATGSKMVVATMTDDSSLPKQFSASRMIEVSQALPRWREILPR